MMSIEVAGPMTDTGERAIPELTDGGTLLAHAIRYRFACRFAHGKRVLDIACGEGYGSAALRTAGATRVVGVDIDGQTVAHARQKYGVDARIGSADRIDLEDGSIDLAVSFETIEHLKDPLGFLREMKRVLTPEGKLVISTPNKAHAADGESHNPFHLSEMTAQEFRAALDSVFPSVEYFSQCLLVAPLFSVRALASLHTRPSFRPLSGAIFRLRPWLFGSGNASAVAELRKDAPRAIVEGRPTSRDMLFDPMQIRPMSVDSWDESTFFLAIARPNCSEPKSK
jgi:hypothetical protein